MKPWEKNLRQVTPYTPGEQPNQKDMIKLNTNENPYPPAPGVAGLLNGMDPTRLRLYPDPTAGSLVSCLAKYYGVGNDQVFVGVGSDDVLAMVFMAFFNSDKPVFFPDITYSFYPVWADLFQIPYETKPLDEHLRIKASDYYPANGGVIFPNPNAPTSYYENLAFIEDILQHNQDVIVVIDEAYVDFAPESALKLVSKYENLVVVQTFSKARSMAGMRIGYAIANPVLIKALNDVKYAYNSYTMNMSSLAAGVAAVEDVDYFETNIQKIIKTRTWVANQLTELGFEFPEPSANFIFAKHPQHNGKQIFEALRARHIYVRRFDSPGIEDYLRITMGTDAQMEIFFENLIDILSKM